MAGEHGEIHVNPTPPPPVVGDPSGSSSAKRPREDGDAVVAGGIASDFQPPPKRRVVLPQEVLYRIMLPSRQIGKVIGKEGSRIQKIREETKATIKIADAVSRNEERVIIISSKDSENIFTDAENALHQIACLILKMGLDLCSLMNRMVIQPLFDSNSRHTSHVTCPLFLRNGPAPFLRN